MIKGGVQILVVLHKNFQFVVLVISGDIRFENMPISSPKQAYELWSEFWSVNIYKISVLITCRGAK